MKKFVLANTDGFSINTQTFDTLEQAYAVMAAAYHEAYPQENGPSSAGISFLAKDNAVLYRDGEDVLVWDITYVEDERANTLIRNLVELLRADRGDLYSREFAGYVMANAGISLEELAELGWLMPGRGSSASGIQSISY